MGQPGDPAALTGRLFHVMVGALKLFTVYLGERLGLYQALHTDGPATSAELAARTGTIERYIREWLEHHAASGLLEVDDPRLGRWLACAGTLRKPASATWKSSRSRRECCASTD